MLTQSELKSKLHYNSKTGIFTWINCKSPRVKTGDKVGYLTPQGYISILIFGKKYQAHRLAWLYMYGRFPKDGIDHKDQNPSNNRILNLRSADQLTNGKNCKLGKSNTSGIIGVCWDKAREKWVARIKVEHKSIHLGRFLNKKDAREARKEADIKYGFSFRHGRTT